MYIYIYIKFIILSDPALVADLEKLCRQVSEFGRVCKRKLRVNVGKSKVMRCSMYGDGG